MKKLGLALLLWPCLTQAIDWEVEWGAEIRAFTDKALEQQARNHGSTYLQPELYQASDNGSHHLFAQLFYRYDLRDTQRSHFDVRELNYTYVGDNFEWLIGYGKVFWGVAESRHLVDVINQTDLVENLDGEDKLGQPMLKLSVDTDFGTFSGFVMPYFRERTFPGQKGRLRSQPVVDTDFTVFESSRGRKHWDYALRWSHSLDIWDIGLAAFHGTARDPRFFLTRKAFDLKLAPLYEVINQYSIDLQATVDAWLWKFEGLRREKQGTDFYAMVGGFEYTLYGILDSAKDLGIVAEYHYDSRNRLSPQPFNDDLAVGFRYVFNDEASTEILALALIDRHLSSKTFRVEASRRLAQHFTLSLEASVFDSLDPRDPSYALRQDNHVQLNLTYHLSG